MASVSDLAACLLPPLDDVVQAWLKEDIPSFDYGGAIVGNKKQAAVLYAKQNGVVAGVPFFDAIFKHLGCAVTWNVSEGDLIDLRGSTRVKVATVEGQARHILMGERIALNILARASGIATKTKKLVEIKEKNQWEGRIAGTRKTTPGFRIVEKHAMLVGGADMHRMDLSSMVMLKDNHIWSHGSITEAVKQARKLCGFSMKIEVECGSLRDAEEAISAGADVVMLDNFNPKDLADAAKTLKAKHKHVLIEGSGGITEATVARYMCKDVDILSTSCIHQGTSHIDFSLKIAKPADTSPMNLEELE
eukprot:m.31260 g.31260  ORF g.31260 m.31260 type:complete len:305 (-) comp8297_c0_seq1:195-1109(-)